MTIQMIFSIIQTNDSIQNALIILAVALLVLLVLKISVKRQGKKRDLNGYYDSRGRYRKAENRKAGSGSNGSQWHSGSYDGRRRR